MKIIEVCYSLTGGGAERFVVDLSNELSLSNDVTLLTLKDDKVDAKKRNFYKNDLQASVRYNNLGLSEGFHFQSLWRIYKFLKRERADIVHLNGYKLPHFCILAIILIHKTVFIETIHSDIACYKNLLYWLFASSVGRRLFDYHFVALSKKNYEDMKKTYPYADSYMVFNGRSPLKRTELYNDVFKMVHSFDDSALICIHVARFNEAKNQQMLIRSFNRIIKEGYNVQLIVLGDGFDSIKGRELQSISNPNIHFLGPKNNVADYLLSSDMFCLSSIYEGLPISVLEAQLCGLPVVSTPVCGVIDVVKNEFDGILSTDFSENSYVNALKTAISKYQILRKNAKELITNSPYTMKKCAMEYLEIFKKTSQLK